MVAVQNLQHHPCIAAAPQNLLILDNSLTSMRLERTNMVRDEFFSPEPRNSMNDIG